MRIIKGIAEGEREKLTIWVFQYFKHLIDEIEFTEVINVETNWDISVKLVDETEKVVGLYLFGDRQVTSLVNTYETQKYKTLKGIEGVLLAVDESIRGQGWGNKLKDYPKTLGIDYIWGQQLHGLNNLEDWTKRRVLIAKLDEVYVTLENFTE